MKRKANGVATSTDKRKDDTNKDSLNSRQSNPSTHPQLKGKKGFSYEEASRPVKLNHRNTKDIKGFSPNVPIWEARKWPLKPLTTINTNPNYYFSAGSDEHESSKEPVGNIPEGENNTFRDVNNHGDSERPDEYHGMVWRRGHDGLEEHIPLDKGECLVRILADGGRSMDEHPQPLLALLDGSTKILASVLSATRDSLRIVPLRKITNSLGGDSPGTSDLTEKDIARETHRDGPHGEFVQSEAPPIYGSNYCAHLGYSQQSQLYGNTKACSEPFPKDYSGEKGTETGMDVEEDRGGIVPNVF